MKLEFLSKIINSDVTHGAYDTQNNDWHWYQWLQ